ncbi:hypothetical protein BGC07_07900 [Piscirickettsia litoralis]|uniref:Uncharacterized protein n=2 Tax=Piscirickettsia litoralis TaxID=1891921 RepID=A0ABX3A594_9GAMM|nr:hypothetical protein BGC07_07900 [Piscirickettsia litoralis]
MMVALLLASFVIAIAVMLYLHFDRAARFSENKLNVARKAAVGLQMIVNDVQTLQSLSPINCPELGFQNRTGEKIVGIDEASLGLVKIYPAGNSVLKQLGIEAIAGTQALLAYLPKGSLNYLELAAKSTDTSLRLNHAENKQGTLWVVANCKVKLLLLGRSYRSNVILNHALGDDIAAGATVWPLELRVFYIGQTSQGNDALFLRDDSGRHELVEDINSLKLSYGWVDSGQLVWSDRLLSGALLALIKISLSVVGENNSEQLPWHREVLL